MTDNNIIKKLANRLIRYERFKLSNAPDVLVNSTVRLIAEIIDQLEEIDCEKLRYYIEECLIQDYKCEFLVTKCPNCKNFLNCSEFHDPCYMCEYSSTLIEGVLEICEKCEEVGGDDWIIWNNAHKKCESYSPPDREHHDKFVQETILLAEILQRKYGINKRAVEIRINNLTRYFDRLQQKILKREELI